MQIKRNFSVSMALAGGMLLMAIEPAGAHHSFAMFDSHQTIVVNGTISKFDITTPHSWLFLIAADGANWSFESEGPGALARAGIHRSTVKVGDKVEVTMHPMRGRPNVGSLISIKAADGNSYSIMPLQTRPDAGEAPK